MKLFKLKQKTRTVTEITPDMSNLVNSMFLCTPLYDKLKIKCHPDRFFNESQKSEANNLFQELQKNKFNYKQLLEVELQIIEFLKKQESATE